MIRRVGLFVTCLIDQFYPRVGFDAVKVLERLGMDVVVPQNQTCCGEPAFNSGYANEARPVLDSALACLEAEKVDAIVVPSGSCASMLRIFSHELVGHREIASRIFEFSQFLTRVLRITDTGARFNAKVVYHESCHLLRALHEDSAPRTLLRSVKGLDLCEFPEPVCCGFGGTFSVKMSEISHAMLEDKVRALRASGADAVVSCDMGCLMHIAGGLQQAGLPIQTLHLAEVLART